MNAAEDLPYLGLFRFPHPSDIECNTHGDCGPPGPDRDEDADAWRDDIAMGLGGRDECRCECFCGNNPICHCTPDRDCPDHGDAVDHIHEYACFAGRNPLCHVDGDAPHGEP